MVYYLGSKNTLRHYANTKLLDGNPHKIEVADTTPDAGFDLNTASTYPANQGRPIRTEYVPTCIEWQEKAPVPDVITQHGMIVVPERFRQIVEHFEPGIHQFLAVKYVDKNKNALADRYYFIAGNRIDSVDRTHTTMILRKGFLWVPARNIPEDSRQEEVPEGFDMHAPPKIVFSNAQIGDKHAWADKFMPLSGPYLSDALGDALIAEAFSGIAVPKAEAV